MTSRRRRSARRRPAAIALSLIAIVLICAGGLASFLAVQHANNLQAVVVADLQQGAAELQSAKSAVVKANSPGGDRGQLDQATSHFGNARIDFQRAIDRVEADPLLRSASFAPAFGGSYVLPRLRTVEAVARMGIDLASAGQESIQLDAALLAPGAPGTKTGAKILAVMAQALVTAPVIRSALQSAQTEAASVDVAFLPGSQRDSFAKAKGDIAKGLADMTEFEQLAPAVTELLGGNGSRTYLVEQPDPAELRAGGGFLGSYSLITANQGEITLGKAGNTVDFDSPYPKVGSPKYVLPPGPVQQFAGYHGYVFGDSNFLPDFPQSAQTGERLYTSETGTKVDGVVSLDPWAIGALLAVTGPIAIPEWNTTVDGATFPEMVFQQQEKVSNQQANRKAFFSAVASSLIGRIMTLPSGQWSQLIKALNTVVTERHLQIYVNNQTAQREIDRIGWSGAMVSPTAADETMMEVESNFSADKANHWIKRTYDFVLTVQGAKLHHAMTVSYVNSTPPGYLGGQRYYCYIRLYYPASASGGQISAAPDRIPNAEEHPGYKMLDGWFTIDALGSGSGSGSVRIAWDTPWDPTSTKRIYWQKQAGTISDAVNVTYVIDGRTYMAKSDLTQDRVLVLSPSGVSIVAGAAGQAQLPLIGSLN